MTFETIIIIALLLMLIILLILLFKKLNTTPSKDSNQLIVKWLQSMTNNINANNKNISSVLTQTTNSINKRLDSTIGIVSDSTKELTKMNELGKSIRNLQEILQSPKLRGNLGEEILSDMLAQVFPKEVYRLQYPFKSGARVDAAILTGAGILPIDAKFPMENYLKYLKEDGEKERTRHLKQFISDVKKHIKDISQKYILSSENTVDFAFMYVPSEAVFLEISNHPDLMKFARDNRVYPVSPNTLYAHLQTVLLSFQGLKIEKNAQKILTLLKSLQKDYDKTFESVQILGKHLTNAGNQYTNTFSQMSLMGQKLDNQELLEEGK